MTDTAENVLRILKSQVVCDYYLCSSYKRKVKSLSGFIQGMHFLPKNYNSAATRFVERIATDDIHKEGSAVSLRLRESLELKSVDYFYEESEGNVIFECKYFQYRLTAQVNPENLSEAVFLETITPATFFSQKANQVLNCLLQPRYDAHLQFKRTLDIEEVIEFIEQNYDNPDALSYEYSLDKTQLQLYIKPEQIEITFEPNEARIRFPNKSVLSMYIGAL